ncbi:MAG: OmpA family protein [Chitinophagales bacterium]|nr:OmpA family protein [Chitinophagales bacterium]
MEDNYLIIREYEERINDSKSSVHVNFIEFKHSNGLYYFALTKGDKVILRSEGYKTESSRDQGIHSVIKNCGDKNNYRTESAHGAHFLILLAGNHKEIARSYPMKEEIETFITLNSITSNTGDTNQNVIEDHLTIAEEKVVTPVAPELEIIEEPSVEEDKPSELEHNETKIDVDPPAPQDKVEEPTKIISSPLLESFQKEITSSETKEVFEKKEIKPELDDFEIEEDIIYEAEQINNEVQLNSEESKETTEENKTIDDYVEIKNIPNTHSSEINSEPKSELGRILAEEEKSSKGSLKWLGWLILLILTGALIWWLTQMKGCDTIKSLTGLNNSKDSIASASIDKIKSVDSLSVDQASIEAKATWEKTLGGMVSIRLPDGSLINVPENGTERKLVEYLEAKCGTSELKKTWFDMDRILFKSGTNQLKEISDEQITLIAKIFKSYPKKKFKIGGYTDNVGDPEANIRLSAIRAEAATRAIIAKGIDSARLRYEGYGQEHPICPENNTEECRAKNRRVAIRVDFCE